MMLSTRTISTLLLCSALLAMAGQPGSAQQDGNRPTAQEPAPPQKQEPAPPQNQTPAPDPAQQDQAPQTPVFRGGINFVRVDVIVDDRKSQPVTTLTQADFEVLEDGKPQSVEQFSLIKVDGNVKPGDPPPREIRTRADEELIANRDDVRVFVFFLDDYHVRRANSMSVREPLQRFIQNQLRPNDIVSVMYPLTPVSDLSFTRNHNAISTAIERFVGRKFDYTPLNQFEQNYMRYPTETVERIRNDIVMSALRGLAVRLGSLREGRKSVVFVSEGFTAMLPPQMRRADASQPANPIETALSAGSQDSSAQITSEWFGQTDVYSRMREVVDSANRNNTSFYSLDPRGLAPFEYGFDDIPTGPPPSFATDSRALRMTQDTLRSLSEETDGRAIVNRNTLEQGLSQVVRDSSFYYLLGYTSQAANDGKFHEITVRVKRRDVNVRARRGFWAVTPEDAVRAANPTTEVAKPVQTALASIATSVQAGKYVRTWLGTERGEGGKTRVTFVWEPLPTPPGERRESAGRVAVLAATSSGDLVYRGRTPERPQMSGAAAAGPTTATAPAANISATAQRLTFDAPPGKVELRITVEGAAGGTLDAEVRDLEVPDFTAPQVSLSTPRLYRARTLPELRAITADPNAVPAAGRDFSRTERLLIRFSAYGAGADRPEATAVLLNRAGQKMSDVPVTPSTQEGTTHEISLGLATIPAGEYLVEVTAKGASGEAKQLIPFKVTS